MATEQHYQETIGRAELVANGDAPMASMQWAGQHEKYALHIPRAYLEVIRDLALGNWVHPMAAEVIADDLTALLNGTFGV